MRIDFKSKKQIILIVFIALTLCFIFGQSVLPPDKSMETSDDVAEAVDGIFSADESTEKDNPQRPFLTFVIEHIRKIAHFVEHGILGIEVFLLFLVLEKESGKERKIMPIGIKTLLFSLNIGLLVGFFDESIQILSGRNSSTLDVWLDFAGYITFTALITLGFILAKALKERKKHRA